MTTRVTGFIKKHEKTGQVLGGERLELPERVLETTGMWVVLNETAEGQNRERLKKALRKLVGGEIK